MSENIPQPQVEVEVEEEKKKNTAVPGIVDYESDSEKVEEMVVENENIIDNNEINKNSEDSVEMSEKYGFYKMFWGLQEFMCTENAKRFVDCAAVMIGEEGKISDVLLHLLLSSIVNVIIIEIHKHLKKFFYVF